MSETVTRDQLKEGMTVWVWPKGFPPQREVIRHLFDNRVETNFSAHIWYSEIFLTTKALVAAIRAHGNAEKARFDKMADEVEGL